MNYILTIILYLSLSCETTLLMLSCDCIESAKFIPGTLSVAKLVYYIAFGREAKVNITLSTK